MSKMDESMNTKRNRADKKAKQQREKESKTMSTDNSEAVSHENPPDRKVYLLLHYTYSLVFRMHASYTKLTSSLMFSIFIYNNSNKYFFRQYLS